MGTRSVTPSLSAAAGASTGVVRPRWAVGGVACGRRPVPGYCRAVPDPAVAPRPDELSPSTRRRGPVLVASIALLAATVLGIGSTGRDASTAAWSLPGGDGSAGAGASGSAADDREGGGGAFTAPYLEPDPAAPPTTAAPAPATTAPAPPPTTTQTWYAPYVDLTLTPRLAFEDPAASPAEHVVLGFVVADPDDGCTPTWGGVYDLDRAAADLDLDARLARHRERGGDVIASFGGFANDELAVACADEARLASAYRAVVDRYGLSTIDLDIEGTALADGPSITRRARAVAAVQQEAEAAGRPLAVWLTLPVSPAGLAPDALAVVDATLAGGVRLSGVNVMTMNYAESRPADIPMAFATVQALEATHRQLAEAYARSGSPVDDAEVWSRVGATPMLGVNDENADVTTLDDARALRDLAVTRGLGRVSMWSANRDAPCTEAPGPSGVSNTCSGVEQEPLAFSRLFGELSGSPTT